MLNRKQKNLVVCPDCGSPMGIEKSRRRGLYYRCLRYPLCHGNHSTDKEGNPIGFPANARTREARTFLHRALRRVWNDKNKYEREMMYDWLKMNSKYGHVSQMDYDEIQQVLKKLKSVIPFEA